MASNKVSRVIKGRYPLPGTSPVADAIRLRRGARGITPLDAALLHVPPIAGGWNSLLGAVRTQGNLPGDVRELMILRVAAINGAAFEWIHHEHVGRTNGLNTAQLYIIRDITTPLPPSAGIFSPLQVSALMFADASTRKIKINKSILDNLKKNLEIWAYHKDTNDVTERTEDLLVEAAAVVASYNMVSRFLVSLDVAGISDDEVPWPVEREEHFVPITLASDITHSIHAITITASPSAPWIVFANSLLTDLSMWEYLIPFFISDSPDPTSGKAHTRYNVLIHSQRGHGLSTLSSPTHNTTIPALASDISHLILSLNIQHPVHAVIGVSQGGAAALAFARSYPHLTRNVVACDTAAWTPDGNKEAWAERIGMVYGGIDVDEVLSGNIKDERFEKGHEYAAKVGMGKLARVTVPRWFAPPSKCADGETERKERNEWLKKMVEGTSVDGFVAGARALSEYDILQGDENSKTLFTSPVERVLLLAGSLDGSGKVGNALQRLCGEWNEIRCKEPDAKPVEYVDIKDAGHLPMVDETERFAAVLRNFLDSSIA